MSIPRNLSFLAEGASATGVLGVANGGTGVTTSTGTGSTVLSTTPTFTTNITAPLIIGGTAVSSTINIRSTSGVGTSDAILFSTGSQLERMRIDSAGLVGIGTASPSGQLTVQGAGQATPSFNTAGALGGAAVLSDTGVAGNNGGALLFAAASGSWRFAAIKGLVSNGASNTQGDIAFLVRPAAADATLTEKMRITAAGLVGIGTVAPTAALHVPGNSTTIAAILTNIAEPATISATAATGTIAYYPSTQSVLYYTTNASGNWTLNITFSAGTTMNTAMTTGQSMTVVFLVTNGATAYYNNVLQIDGSTVTPKYQGGTAYVAGNASSVDIYTYTIFKTGNAAFTVFASQTKFA
jgi:hypothetical protein